MSSFPNTIHALERGIESGLHLGAQIAVLQNGELKIEHAVGDNVPGQPLTTHHLMPWLSTSKPVTAIAILQLVERHQLQLNDAVSRFIPEFAAGGKQNVTVRHLLTHTGGFRDGDKISEHLTWDETIARVCSVPLEADWIPGEKAGYHLRGSWFILGELIRRIDGRPVDQYVQEEIFRPMGIQRSWLALPEAVLESERDRIGVLHLTHDITPVPHPFLNRDRYWMRACPGSSLRGPVVELATFYDHLRQIGCGNADSVISKETFSSMISRQRDGMFDLTFQHIVDWGLGIIINSARHGRNTVPYGFGPYAGENAYGHGGMQSSSAFVDPQHQLTVAWITNGMPGEPKHQQRNREINASVYEDLGLAN